MNDIHVAVQYFLNDRLEPDELERQIGKLAEAGVQCIFAHARAGMRTPYFSEPWWEVIAVIRRACRRYQIRMAIWDEDNYPSLVAGNRLIWNQPQLHSQVLSFHLLEHRGGGVVEAAFPDDGVVLRCFALRGRGSGAVAIDVTGYCGSLQLGWTARRIQHDGYSGCCEVAAPHWRSWPRRRCFGLLWEAPEPADWTIVAVCVIRPESRNNADILNPATTAAFLDCTHEEYRRRAGTEFERDFAASFLDEPAPAGPFPWTGEFAAEFRRDHGYDLSERLYHLALDFDAATPLVRHHYRQTQMRLQCDHYLRQIGEWCAGHRIQSIGHLTRAEFLTLNALYWPNELRCLGRLDIPCGDPLGANITWHDAGSNCTGLKVVSSAARLFGKRQAGSDALAVCGEEVSLRQFKTMLDFHLALGITYFNLHGFDYSTAGARKDEAPPSLFFQHSEWPLFGELLHYLDGRCRALAAAPALRHIAVLYPATSFYCAADASGVPDTSPETAFHRFVETLLSHQRDFDFIDEVTLQERAAISEAWADYRVILLFQLRFIDRVSAAALERIAAAGIRVVCIGGRPRLLGDPDCPQSGWETDRIECCDDLTAPFLAGLPGVPVTGDRSRELLVLEQHMEDGRRFFAFNRSEFEFSGTLEGLPLTLAPGESRLIEVGTAATRTPESVPWIPVSDWEVEFAANTVPLNFWRFDAGSVSGTIDWLRRDAAFPTGIPEVVLRSRFLASGAGWDSLRLQIEADDRVGLRVCRINGGEMSDRFRPDPDNRVHWFAEIGDLVHSGGTPTLNEMEIIVDGNRDDWPELPFLFGDFAVEFRYGHPSLPVLTATVPCRTVKSLLDWRNWGYGTYSGRAVYRVRFRLDVAGCYRLDLGRVEDAAVVAVDGGDGGDGIRCCWPPYRVDLGRLESGVHILTVEVWNAPANRTRLSGLPAGLLSEPALFRYPEPDL